MVNFKFKVGDNVLVTNKKSSASKELDGKICKIKEAKINNCFGNVYYILEEEIIPYGTWEDELTLVKEENVDSGADITNLLSTEIDYSKGSKYDSGKAPIHMIPEEAILGTALAFGYGAKKYDRFNYRKGIEFTRLQDSLMRHMLAFSQGQDNDDESGLPHLYHAAANVAMLIYMAKNKPELDDRDKRKNNA